MTRMEMINQKNYDKTTTEMLDRGSTVLTMYFSWIYTKNFVFWKFKFPVFEIKILCYGFEMFFMLFCGRKYENNIILNKTSNGMVSKPVTA